MWVKWGDDGYYDERNKLTPELLLTSATVINLGNVHVRVPKQGTLDPDQSHLHRGSPNTCTLLQNSLCSCSAEQAEGTAMWSG